MASTHDPEEIRIELDFDPRSQRPERDWGMALLMLAMAAIWAFMVFDDPASIGQRVGQILITALLGFVALLALLPAADSNPTLAHFDFFGRIDPKALARKRGRLAIAARVLEQNRATLKGEFTVVTAAGRHWDRFPKGGGAPIATRYVALASNREPVALFIHWAWLFPFNPSILIHEYPYRLYSVLETPPGEEYYHPALRITRSDGQSKRLGDLAYFVGEGIRRALGLEHGPKRVRTRLWLHEVTPENIQSVIDQFVAGTRERNRAPLGRPASPGILPPPIPPGDTPNARSRHSRR